MTGSQLRLSLFLLLAACSGDDLSSPAGLGECRIVELPLAGSSNAPLVTDVTLELQQRNGVVVLTTVTDPQGGDNLADVPQIIKVFQDASCQMSPIVLEDEVAGSGMEERLGSAAPRSSALYDAVAAADSWPVELDFRDLDGNRTSGRVLAQVMRP